jgi:ABC-type branched-subunit amino acid transport system permease subunit
VAQNRTLAEVLGLDVSRLVTLTFVLNAALTAGAAVLIAPVYLVKYDIGVALGLKTFYAAIIGGFNQIRGALLGGRLVGLVETPSGAYISGPFRDALAIVIAVLLLKPEGLWAYWILSSRWGRAFRAIRENELRAAVVGVSLRTYKPRQSSAGASWRRRPEPVDRLLPGVVHAVVARGLLRLILAGDVVHQIDVGLGEHRAIGRQVAGSIAEGEVDDEARIIGRFRPPRRLEEPTLELGSPGTRKP